MTDTVEASAKPSPTNSHARLDAWLATLLLLVLYLLGPAREAFSQFKWSTSEMHVSYAAGFVRRGLLGTVLGLASTTTGVPTITLLASAFGILYAVFVALYVRLLDRTVASRGLFWMLALSPAAALFPVYDFGAYLRKEVIAVVLILWHSLHLIGRRPGQRSSLGFQVGIAVSLGVSMLIHELQAFVLGFHAALLWEGGSGPAWRRLWPLGPALLLVPAVAVFHGTPAQAFVICSSWYGIDCGGIQAIGWTFSQNWQLVAQMLGDPHVVATYVLAFGLALVPVYLVAMDLRDGGTEMSTPLAMGMLALAPTMALFALGWDWGRWIHLAVVHVTACILALAGARGQREPRTRHPRSGAATAIAVALLAVYAGAWHLPHCCPTDSLRGGLYEYLPALARTLHIGAD